MRDSIRFQLHFGSYRTPRFKYGAVVHDESRGDVKIVGITAGRIPWPIGKKGLSKSPVLFKGLMKAVRKESGPAVHFWWGVSMWQTLPSVAIKRTSRGPLSPIWGNRAACLLMRHKMNSRASRRAPAIDRGAANSAVSVVDQQRPIRRCKVERIGHFLRPSAEKILPELVSANQLPSRARPYRLHLDGPMLYIADYDKIRRAMSGQRKEPHL